MKIFLSWSGQRSREIAVALHDWLPDVIYGAEPWLSTTDINKGSRWALELATQLEQSKVGILCLTSSNLGSPWLNFEAGALAKSVEKTFVCTYLCGIDPAVLAGPLAQFQATRADKEDTEKLVQVINQALGEKARPRDRVKKGFEKFWPDLEKHLNCSAVPEEELDWRSSDANPLQLALRLVEILGSRMPLIPPPAEEPDSPHNVSGTDPESIDGFDPNDPAAIDDTMAYLENHGISVSRSEVQEFLTELKASVLRWSAGNDESSRKP
jgi:hypothetical protein